MSSRSLSQYLPPPFTAAAEHCYYRNVKTDKTQAMSLEPPQRPPPSIPITSTTTSITSSSTITASGARRSSSPSSLSSSSSSSSRSISPSSSYIEALSPAQIQALALTARRKQTQSHSKLSQILGDAMLLDVLELELQAERRRSYERPRHERNSGDADERGRAREREPVLIVTSVEEVDGDD